jgi:hypothetical protein
VAAGIGGDQCVGRCDDLGQIVARSDLDVDGHDGMLAADWARLPELFGADWFQRGIVMSLNLHDGGCDDSGQASFLSWTASVKKQSFELEPSEQFAAPCARSGRSARNAAGFATTDKLNNDDGERCSSRRQKITTVPRPGLPPIGRDRSARRAGRCVPPR